MKLEIAQRIVENIKLSDDHWNRVAEIIEEIEDIDERKAMRRRLGEVMGATYDILRPIELEYPSLRI